MIDKTNETVNRIKAVVAEALMNAHGYKRDENTAPMEWDPNRKDSQYSMMYEDAEIAVDTAISELLNMENDEDEQIIFVDEEEEDAVNPTVTTSTAIFIFCDAGIGNPMYVRDVRQWLNAVDAANIPDDAEVEGRLHLDYDIRNNPLIEQIECGECGYQDTLITHHTCKAIEEHKRKREEGDT